MHLPDGNAKREPTAHSGLLPARLRQYASQKLQLLLSKYNNPPVKKEPGRWWMYTCGHCKTALFSFILQPILTPHIPSFNIQVSCLSQWSLKLCGRYSLATHTLQTAHLPILPLYLTRLQRSNWMGCYANLIP